MAALAVQEAGSNGWQAGSGFVLEAYDHDRHLPELAGRTLAEWLRALWVEPPEMVEGEMEVELELSQEVENPGHQIIEERMR